MKSSTLEIHKCDACYECKTCHIRFTHSWSLTCLKHHGNVPVHIIIVINTSNKNQLKENQHGRTGMKPY